MPKYLLALLILLLLAIALAALLLLRAPRAADCRTVRALLLHCRPAETSRALDALPAGEPLALLGFRGCFAHVERASGARGYVLSGGLTPLDPPALLRGEWTVQPTARYSYRALVRDLRTLAAEFPGRLAIEEIGRSREGRPILAAAVGTGPKCVLLQAGIHGREHMASLFAMALLESLLREGVEAGLCYHIIPMANPDGVAISQGEAPRWKANAAGVDLNRNFPAGWEGIESAEKPGAEGYRGPAPASEPETQALMAYTEAHAFAATLSFHAMGSEVYDSFGPPSAANRAGRRLGRHYARAAGYALRHSQGRSAGGYKDWAIAACGIPSLTIELGAAPCPLPREEFDLLYLRNRKAVRAVAKALREFTRL